jgi:ABC-type glycerol-3-phosphate transport system substrate-binding protein
MKKTIIISLIMVGLAVSVFAGGGQQGTKGTSGGPVELVYWSHYGQSPAFVQAFADASNVALKKIGQNNVTVRAEVIEYSGWQTKYLTAFASGNGPDIFLANQSDYALEGGTNPIALPFPEDLNKIWTDALASLYKNGGMFNGKRYGFPAEGGSLQYLYVNSDHFKEIGLDAAKDYPKTIDQFLAIAQKLTKYDSAGKVTRSGYHPRYLGAGDGVAGKWFPFYHQFGARVLSPDLKQAKGYINGPQAIEAFQFYQDLVTKYKVVNLDFGAPETAFQSGQTSMIFREGWFAQDIIDKAPNIKFLVVPYVSGKVDIMAGGGGSGGWQNMINSRSKHVDIILALFKELAKPEYDVMLHEPAGYPPVLEGTMKMDNPYFGVMPIARATIDSLYKPLPPDYDKFAQWSTVQTMVGDSVAAVLNGANVNAELNALADKVQVVLDQK